MQKNPETIIFLSAYNAQNTLQNTLESIQKQSYNDWEAWIIDDDSQDNSWQIIQDFAQKEPRCKAWKNPQNQGLTKSLNMLWEKLDALSPNTTYVSRFDADDVMYPNKLQRQVDFMQKNLHISLVGSYADCKENLDKQSFYHHLPTDTQIIKTHLLSTNPIIHGSAVIKVRDWQTHIQYYDESFRLGQDFEAWTRMIQKGLLIQILPEVLMNFSDFPNRITSVKKDFLTESFYRIREKNFKFFFGIQTNPEILDLYHGLISVYPKKISLDFLKQLYDFILLILKKNQENKKQETQIKYFEENILFDFFQKRFNKCIAGQTHLGYKFGIFYRNCIFSPYKNFSFWQKIKFWTKIFLKIK